MQRNLYGQCINRESGGNLPLWVKYERHPQITIVPNLNKKRDEENIFNNTVPLLRGGAPDDGLQGYRQS